MIKLVFGDDKSIARAKEADQKVKRYKQLWQKKKKMPNRKLYDSEEEELGDLQNELVRDWGYEFSEDGKIELSKK